MHAVTYIDSNRDFRTYRFKLLRSGGMIQDLANRLRYAAIMIERLLSIYAGTLSAEPTTKSLPSNAPEASKHSKPGSSAVQKAVAAGNAAAARAIAAVSKPGDK